MRSQLLLLIIFFVGSVLISAGLSVALITEAPLAHTMIDTPVMAYIIFGTLFAFILGMVFISMRLSTEGKRRKYIRKIRSIVLD